MTIYKKLKNGSYLHNCYIAKREDDPQELIVHEDGRQVFVSLNGYAIIPLEEYEKLTSKDSMETKIRIKNADKQLHGFTIPKLSHLSKSIRSINQDLVNNRV